MPVVIAVPPEDVELTEDGGGSSDVLKGVVTATEVLVTGLEELGKPDDEDGRDEVVFDNAAVFGVPDVTAVPLEDVELAEDGGRLDVSNGVVMATAVLVTGLGLEEPDVESGSVDSPRDGPVYEGPDGVAIVPEELGDSVLEVPTELGIAELVAFEDALGLAEAVGGLELDEAAARGTVVNAVEAPGVVFVTSTVVCS